MERALQYWDDLDDLIGILGLYAENIRRVLLFVFSTLCFLASLTAAAAIAYSHQPLGLAFVTLLLVTLMYRSVTAPHPTRWRAARRESNL